MKLEEIINAEELYFIDLETVNSIGICQIGITKWSKKENRLSIVFNEIINPDVKAEEINKHAMRVHGISEYTWSSAKPYSYFHNRIKNLLDGKIVFQWGGNDVGTIYKNIRRYNLSEIKTTSLNSWTYQFKGMKLVDAAKNLGVSFSGAHRAQSDSFITGLVFVMDLFNYEITSIDLKIIDSFNTQAKVRNGGIQRFNTKKMKINGSGDEICLTGFTDQEKMKFGELLAKKGYRVRTSVTSDLRFLVTPSNSYKGSPSKEIEAKNVGAKIVDLNSFLKTYA
jgi:DNA polymerase III alpha subunit (gram-positive type)